MADVYDRFASPTQRVPAVVQFAGGAAEEKKMEKRSRLCLAVWGGVLSLILFFVILNAIVMEKVSVKSTNGAINFSDSISNFDSLEKMEKVHLGLITDIKNRIDGKFDQEESLDDEESIKDMMDYLGEVRNKLDQFKSSATVRHAPNDQVIPPASTFPQDTSVFTKDVRNRMSMDYLADEKLWPYVGYKKYIDMFNPHTAAYYNSLAVFPFASEDHMHGLIGLNPDGSRWWHPLEEPPTITKGTPLFKEALERGGGFYLDLSDHLPLDRPAFDSRPAVCKNQKLTVEGLPDASVIITFYNEPLSTLLRTVHSVLNTVPPPLLNEIVLVDDHSTLDDNGPGGPLYEALKLLPKTKILRLPHRHGLVQARLAGIKDAKGEAVVILDSHVEANRGWMEPLLMRLKESPKSLVYPQIPSIDPVDFSYQTHRGIGCKLSFKWIMQEQSTAVHNFETADPVPSASMAGGLFAVYRDFFWYMGGYDEGMTMWGAENVEMPFRYWMCGARVECMPCSRVYHIYRNGGTGYKSPSNSVTVNRLRTAYLWTDQYYPLAHAVINNGKEIDIGSIDTVLAFKEKMKCKSFNWFLDTMGLDREPKHLADVDLVGEVKSLGNTTQCLDNLGNKQSGDPIGTYGCHGAGGTQAWLGLGDNRLRVSNNENLCVNSETLKLVTCTEARGAGHLWTMDHSTRTIRDQSGTKCLALETEPTQRLVMTPCIEGELNPENKFQKWEFHKFTEAELNYSPPRHSEQWLKEHPR